MFSIMHILRNPSLGGLEVLIKNVINENDGINFIHNIVYSNEGPLLDYIHPDRKNRLIHCRFRNHFSYVTNLRRIFKARKADIVHVHQPLDNIYAILATMGLNIPIVRTYHGYTDKKRVPFPNPSRATKLMYPIINHKTKRHLFVSNHLMEYYRRLLPKQDHRLQRVLYNGISLDSIINEPKTNLHQEFNIPEDNIILGMVGSFIDVRDHYTVCRALNILLKNTDKIHFLFIGNKAENVTNLYTQCYKYCEEKNLLGNIHFLGIRQDLGGILKNLDIYIHSSNWDSFGIALVEVMMFGIPCIASDIPPFREISDNGKHIHLFQKGNEEDLVRNINFVLASLNTNALNEKRMNAMRFSKDHFSIQAHMKKLHSYYLEFLAKPHLNNDVKEVTHSY